MKIVFMGSPQFAVPSLEALQASHHEIAAVVTQPDRPVGRNLQIRAPAIKIAAQKLGIPVLQPETTRTQEFVERIRSFHPDLLVVVAYGEILRRNLLEVPPRGTVNLHASLLPKYRGAAPVAWAILNGETETGVSTMMMSEAMDAGPILLQASCSVDPSETAETLTGKLAILGAPLLVRTLDLMERNEIVPAPQDISGVTFAPKLKKQDGWIQWDKKANWISRQIRAFNPWPGSFSSFQGTRIKFWVAHPVEEATTEVPGTIIRVSRSGLLVAGGDQTVLHLDELQPENRPKMTAADFVHGYHVQAGHSFAAASVSSDS